MVWLQAERLPDAPHAGQRDAYPGVQFPKWVTPPKTGGAARRDRAGAGPPASVCKAHGDKDGTRALIEALLLARHLPHEQLVTCLAAALRAGAFTADAVGLGAREAGEDEDRTRPAQDPVVLGRRERVAYLTERRLIQLLLDRRPLPSAAVYDQPVPDRLLPARRGDPAHQAR
ncbi:hypothetical protein ACFYUK_48160 [Nonomuraea wenchangensis]